MDNESQMKSGKEMPIYFNSFLAILKNINNKLAGKHTSVVLSKIQVRKIQNTFTRLINEMFAILDIKFYLDEEIRKKDIDVNKCYYHIDNFYHRIYVLEEMVCRLLSNVFLHKSFVDKEDFEKELNASSCIDVKKIMSDHLKDKEIIEARKRRTELVHRTGYSARELEGLWSRRDGTKRRINEKTKESEERFCKKEYATIVKIMAKWLNFVLKLLSILDKHLRMSKD